MASVQDVLDGQARTDAAIQALADAVANQAPPAATSADLDGFVAAADAQTAAVNAIPR